MSRSTLGTPPDDAGVIPLNPQFWGIDAGIQNPAGGIYSSSNDLAKYLRYILTHYNALATGVNWFNPASPSQGLYSHYGMPWEMFQTDRILGDSKRTVRFITKGGGLPGYFSLIAMVPEYGLGITILVAGKVDMLIKIQDAVVATIVRAAEAIAIRQLQERYAGTYASTNHTLNSTITLEADSRGLVVTEFISNGTDALSFGLPGFMGSDHWYAQLVPTLLYRDEKEQEGELWRMQIAQERVGSQDSIWDEFCINDADRPLYASVAYNEFALWDQKDGKFQTLELSAFRVNLTRTEKREEAYVWNLAQETLEL
jgi:hypothetical protein